MMTTLRFLRKEDAGPLAEKWAGRNALPAYSLPDEREEMERLIEAWNGGTCGGKRFDMLLIEEDGAAAGLLSLYGQEEGVSLGISVHPSMQRRGIAARAVKLAADYARKAGWTRMISQCRADNCASIALHRKCGFEETGRGRNRKGNDVIFWQIDL